MESIKGPMSRFTNIETKSSARHKKNRALPFYVMENATKMLEPSNYF